MIRINLLPPEISQKRRDEKRWRWVILAGIATAVVLALVFVALQFQLSAKQAEVANVKQQADTLQASAARFQVFQDKQADLDNRKKTADTALAGRQDWSKLFSEIGLILPSDIFLTRIGSTEPKAASGKDAATAGKITIDGKALDFPNDVPDLGYKSVAKLLVRLAGLDKIANVWLTQSTKPAFVAASDGSEAEVADRASSYITFSMSADIPVTTTSTPNASGVPAPPKP